LTGATGPAAAGSVWTVITGATGLYAGNTVIADTSSGPYSVSLPSTPSAGNFISIADGDNWKSNNLTVLRNGSTIEELSEDLVLDVADVQVNFVYDGSTWQVFASVGTGGAVGGGDDRIFWENDQVITTNYSVTLDKNAMTAGPVTINDGIEVTVPANTTWTIV